jgi:hypothetical protein
MADPQSPKVLLEYSKLQIIVAESMFGLSHTAAPGVMVSPVSGAFDPAWLTEGNHHSSRLTTTQASEFAKSWALVEHISNTKTGFGGTLFRYKGPDDPSLNLKTNQLVISFRSTEFIEDAVRDNQATNTAELSEAGWAFGQLTDMGLCDQARSAAQHFSRSRGLSAYDRLLSHAQ